MRLRSTSVSRAFRNLRKAAAEAPVQVEAVAEEPAQVEAAAEAPVQVEAVAEEPAQVEAAVEAPAQVEAVAETAAEIKTVQTDAVSNEQPAEAAPQDLETPVAAEAAPVASVDIDSEAPIAEVPATDPVVATLPEAAEAVEIVEAIEPQAEELVVLAVEEVAPQGVDGTADIELPVDATDHVAYEEYLKDNNEPVGLFEAEATEETASPEDLVAAEEPVTKLDSSGDLQIEMDTKNAHVWNELGNVYFNTGAFDDAVIAYSKAIELDRWFAWPYSNLALAYVQKARFAEAILLYQRSIELFGSDKDKAISWNRLGNVYRRMNDYDNAICAYQRADELDPDNTTLSLQSRFSLLGSYAMEEKPSYAS